MAPQNSFEDEEQTIQDANRSQQAEEVKRKIVEALRVVCCFCLVKDGRPLLKARRSALGNYVEKVLKWKRVARFCAPCIIQIYKNAILEKHTDASVKLREVVGAEPRTDGEKFEYARNILKINYLGPDPNASSQSSLGSSIFRYKRKSDVSSSDASHSSNDVSRGTISGGGMAERGKEKTVAPKRVRIQDPGTSSQSFTQSGTERPFSQTRRRPSVPNDSESQSFTQSQGTPPVAQSTPQSTISTIAPRLIPRLRTSPQDLPRFSGA